MILNVSGRTDIVAFYTNWFMNRYKEGFLYVRNPFNPKLVSKISFDNVELILFCTKNPIPILNRLHEIKKPILFHVTLTPYNKKIEPNVIPKGLIIESIKRLSKIIGKDNITVRYDPVFLSDKYTLDYHIKMFDKLCTLLDGYVNKILISFLDDYKNVRNNKNILNYRNFTSDDYKAIGKNFSNSAKKHSISVYTCFEDINLTEYGFEKNECLSQELAYKLTGMIYKKSMVRKGRKCNCVQMCDIGVYNSCKHFCKYCYANYDEKRVNNNFINHDENSPLLIGNLSSDDIIKERFK